MQAKLYDLVVIGAGPGGVWGARTAASLGKRVALVEKTGMIGGAGIDTGTIPSKTLRETALALSGWRSRRLFGVVLSLRRKATIGDFTYHEKNVTKHERKRIDRAGRATGLWLQCRLDGKAAPKEFKATFGLPTQPVPIRGRAQGHWERSQIFLANVVARYIIDSVTYNRTVLLAESR